VLIFVDGEVVTDPGPVGVLSAGLAGSLLARLPGRLSGAIFVLLESRFIKLVKKLAKA
jgi:high-affinity Fe2+/Pb2+ permease